MFPLSKLPNYLPTANARADRDDRVIISPDYTAKTSDQIMEEFRDRNIGLLPDERVHELVVERVHEVKDQLFVPEKMASLGDHECFRILYGKGESENVGELLFHGESRKVFRFIRNTIAAPHIIDMSQLDCPHSLIDRMVDHMRLIKLYKLGLIACAPSDISLWPGSQKEEEYEYTDEQVENFLDAFDIDLRQY